MPPEIVVALIAMPPAVLIAWAQYRTTRSVGKLNGAGSLHDQMADLRSKLEIDEAMRRAGVTRQAEMQTAIERLEGLVVDIKDHLDIVKNDLATVNTVYAQHSVADEATFAELRQAVLDFRALIGEPRDTDDHTPLIPYVHEWTHREKNREAVVTMLPEAHLTVLAEAMGLLKQYRAEIEGKP